MTNPFYVYTHVDPETREILYVGMGKGSRAYATKTVKASKTYYGHRSPEHSDHLDKLMEKGYLPHEWIDFVVIGLTRERALEIEKEFIKSLKPKYNRVNKSSIKMTKDEMLEAIELRKQGLTYKQIGEKFNTTQMVIHRLVNKPGPAQKEILGID